MPTELERQLRQIGQGEHACVLYDSREDQFAVAVPFVRIGLERGERCTYVADDAPIEEVVRTLTAGGIDVERERGRRAIVFLDKDESYFSAGAFTPEAMLDLLRRAEADALADGFTGLRFVGEVTWALGGECTDGRLHRYEALLNELAAATRLVLLCLYRRSRFDAACIHDVLRTHPWAIVGRQVCSNPHYEPPELVLDARKRLRDDAMEERVGWWLRRLARAKEIEQERDQLLGQRQTLSRRLLEIQESERRHLARELHDEIGQLLTGLRLQFKPHGQPSAEALGARLDQARSIVDEIIARVRRLSFDLRPAALDQLGLAPALLALFERHAEQTGLLVSFKHQGIDRRFEAEVETAAYRIVQEALTNVVRHAGVAGATVRVWATADSLSVQVEDRGRGFDPAAARAEGDSSGLAGMRERAILLGGHLSIESRPGSGTRITAEILVQGQAQAED